MVESGAGEARTSRHSSWYRKPFIIRLGIVLACVALHAAAFNSEAGQRLETWFGDRWIEWRGPLPTPDDVVIVAMDEESYPQLQLSSNRAWPRALHAELIRRLAEMGARRVVFDVLFVGPSDSPKVDSELADSLKTMPVVLGAELEASDSTEYDLLALIAPDEELTANVSTLALVNLPEERGYVRQFLPDYSELDYNLPSLAEAAAGYTRSVGADHSLPDDRALINFYGPAGRGLPAYSYYQVLESEVPFPADKIRGKVVFVGLMLRTEMGPAQKDSFLTPFGRMFGVEIHATAANNIIRQDWIRRASSRTELAILSIAVAVLAYLILSFGPVWGAVTLITSALVWAILALTSINFGQFIPGAVAVCIFGPLFYLAATLQNYLHARRKQKQVERAFGHYLSPDMVRELSQNPDALRLGGDLVEATAVFTDLADFTTISERLSAQELVAMLNAYFSVVARVIFAEGGTLVKFLGDAVFVLWGAPLRIEDHPQRATRAALKIHEALEEFNQTKLYPELVTRIGINTGKMVVGNIGAENRFDYTAIGDNVNLAARIEGLNKYLGTTILITEETQRVAQMESALKVGAMQVKGKEVPVVLYALFKNPLDPQQHQRWKGSLLSFQTRKWDRAEQGFTELGSAAPLLAKACEFYCEQIAIMRRDGASAAWKGEIVFTSK